MGRAGEAGLLHSSCSWSVFRVSRESNKSMANTVTVFFQVVRTAAFVFWSLLKVKCPPRSCRGGSRSTPPLASSSLSNPLNTAKGTNHWIFTATWNHHTPKPTSHCLRKVWVPCTPHGLWASMSLASLQLELRLKRSLFMKMEWKHSTQSYISTTLCRSPTLDCCNNSLAAGT